MYFNEESLKKYRKISKISFYYSLMFIYLSIANFIIYYYISKASYFNPRRPIILRLVTNPLVVFLILNLVGYVFFNYLFNCTPFIAENIELRIFMWLTLLLMSLFTFDKLMPALQLLW